MKFGVFVLSLLLSTKIWAAACCGGGSSFPQLITNDDKTHFSFTQSQATSYADAYSDGRIIARTSATQETRRSSQASFSTLVSDSWQAGLTLPLVTQSSRTGERTSLGDTTLSLGYEVLPEWDYSLWKPHGYSYARLTLPTGNSIYDATNSSDINYTGKGFYTFALGSLFVKGWTEWDALAGIEIYHGLNRTTSAAQFGTQTSIEPGFGSSVLIGAGFSPKFLNSWRMGTALSYNVEEGQNIRNSDLSTRSETKKVWETAFQLSYLHSREWIATVQYTDQNLLGRSFSSTLERSVSLLVQRRWER